MPNLAGKGRKIADINHEGHEGQEGIFISIYLTKIPENKTF